MTSFIWLIALICSIFGIFACTSVITPVIGQQTNQSSFSILSNGSGTSFSGKYTNHQAGVEITFPSGWKGLESNSGNSTGILVFNNTNTFSGIIFGITDKSNLKKIPSVLAISNSNNSTVQALLSVPPKCRNILNPFQSTINGMNGIFTDIECPYLLQQETIFETKKDIVNIIFIAPPKDFYKFYVDFNNTINSLRISNTLDTPLADLANTTTTTNSGNTTSENAKVTVQTTYPNQNGGYMHEHGTNGKIAFDSDRDGNNEIYVMNADGTGLTRLTNYSSDSPIWSPDGTKIAFVTTEDSKIQINVMNADGSGQTRLTNSDWPTLPIWSPDGTKIAFESIRDHHSQIYVMNADGTGQTNLSNNIWNDSRPSWSPDGTKIAFESIRDHHSQIYVMNVDGTGQTNLSNNNDDDGIPSWSPDGTKIAFARYYGGLSQIYVMNADGTAQTRLTNSTTYLPIWSPDGTKIAFVTTGESSNQIYVMNTDGTGQTNLINYTTSDLPVWSPDGTKIAFVSGKDGNNEIYVMNSDGTGLTRLINNAWYGTPSWGMQTPIPEFSSLVGIIMTISVIGVIVISSNFRLRFS